MHELVDSGLEEQRVEEIKQVITSVAGVKDVHMLRTRKMGGHASADVHVQVASWLSVSEGHRISEVVMQRLLESVEELVDVTVHIDPEDDESTAPCRSSTATHRSGATSAGAMAGSAPVSIDA